MFAIDKDTIYRELIHGVGTGIADDNYLFFNCFGEDHIALKLTAVTNNRYPDGIKTIYLLMNKSATISLITVFVPTDRVIGVEKLFTAEGMWDVSKDNESLFLSAVYRKLKQKGISLKEFIKVYSDTNAGVELQEFSLREMELLLQKRPKDQFYALDWMA